MADSILREGTENSLETSASQSPTSLSMSGKCRTVSRNCSTCDAFQCKFFSA